MLLCSDGIQAVSLGSFVQGIVVPSCFGGKTRGAKMGRRWYFLGWIQWDFIGWNSVRVVPKQFITYSILKCNRTTKELSNMTSVEISWPEPEF